MPEPPRVGNLTRDEGERVDIHRFPNFSATGSITGMRNKYYCQDALLIRCGSYIYNVSSEPEIYHSAI